MPKITKGGVSNKLVDPDFIAEPGTPVEIALDEGRADVGQESEEQPETHQGRALYEQDDETTDNEQDKPIDEDAPRTPDKGVRNVDSTEGPDAKPKTRPRKATLPK